jgi:DNA-binding transcriptional LysR family regulator
MDLTLRQIRNFVAVADAGKVSLAGSALGISQSAITTSMQALEVETGIKLFKRHSRGVSLTQEGYQFLSHARKILAAVSDATRALKNSNMNVKGIVRFGISPTVAGYFLATPLMHFQRLYPNIEVIITELEQRKIEQGLLDNSLDLAIQLMSTPTDPKRIKTQMMFSSRRRLWLAPGHRLTSVPNIHLSDLSKEPYLLLTTDDNTKTTFRYWQKYGLKPCVYFRTASIEAIRNLVAANAGVTILSDMVYRPWSLQGERIEVRPIADEIPDLKIGIAWKKQRKLDNCAKELCDFCLEGTGIHYSFPGTANRRD